MDVTRDTVSLGRFEFECGESIPELEVAYETYGEYTGDNAILVCHALTGSSHVAGRGRDAGTSGQAAAWWDDIVGPGKSIDPSDYYIVCANVPGSCYGSTGPASENPETGEPYGPDFPPVTITDWTRAQSMLLEILGVDSLHAVVGGSVGGMNVLEWAKLYPDFVEKVVPIATAARLDPQALALDSVARRAILNDPKWRGGRYYSAGDDGEPDPPKDGLRLARQIGHIMYLSKDSMEDKFGRRSARRDPTDDEIVSSDPTSDFFKYRDVESYLDYQSEKFAKRFDPNSYIYLLRAMDDYDLSQGYESDADALAAFDGEALIISFTGDWHFTVEQSRSLERAFEEADVDVEHTVQESDYGHDAFLVEPENVGPAVSGFLD
ncbi:MAG: homoserine O-acetyltransferase [Halobacteria archaeon]|nr:homoserine O-acetyltransferase [Halobacteria archaeon]